MKRVKKEILRKIIQICLPKIQTRLLQFEQTVCGVNKCREWGKGRVAATTRQLPALTSNFLCGRLALCNRNRTPRYELGAEWRVATLERSALAGPFQVG